MFTSELTAKLVMERIERNRKMMHYMYLPISGSRVSLAIKQIGSCAYVAMAFCSPKDQFCRRKGRAMARQRLIGGYNTVIVPLLNDGPGLKDQVATFMYGYLSPKQPGVPSWVTRDRRCRMAGIQVHSGVFSSGDLECGVAIDDHVVGVMYLSKEFVQAILDEFPREDENE